jgi:hypothetical protein
VRVTKATLELILGSPLRGDGPDAPHSASIEMRHLPEARLWTACGFGNDPLLLTEGQGRGFCTSIHVVRVSTKLLKILIAALSPSVAY